MAKNFEYGVTTIGELQVHTKTAEDKRLRRRFVTEVLIDDEPLKPTGRFWMSLYMRYGFSKSFFNYFTHEEVFSRISEVSPNDRMRYCIERDEKTGRGELLAVSNPAKPVVRHDDLMELLDLYQGGRVAYHDGVVESHHIPRMGSHRFQIAGEEFANRFVLQTPIDGFGLPNIYLSLLREICSNGMVGMGKTFRSQITIGKGQDATSFSLMRALDGFGNDEGYAALRQRFESAASSWASVHEALSLYNLTAKLLGRKQIGSDGAQTLPDDGGDSVPVGSPVLKSFHKMTGDISSLYGLANLDALSIKRQRTLPVNCKVYDLLNFATEIATHRARPEGARRLQAWVGTILSNEFDMEGTADNFGDFRDFFVDGGEARKTLDGFGRKN